MSYRHESAPTLTKVLKLRYTYKTSVVLGAKLGRANWQSFTITER